MGLFGNLFNGAHTAAKSENNNAAGGGNSSAETGINDIPDTPLPFGYKSTWLCVKSNSAEEVIEKLELKNAVKCNWKSGFESLNEGIFVSPVLDGWVLVIGWGDDIITEDPERLDSVGKMFPEVQYFSSHRVADYYAWVKYVGGVKIRSYCYCGGEGEVYENVGELTPEEEELGLTNLIPDSESDWDQYDFADEEHVVAVAAAWGVDTLKMEKYPPSTGYFCKI